MKLVVVDRSPEVRGALARLLAPLAGVELAGAAGDVAAALALIDRTRPALVVLDVALHDARRGSKVLAHVRAHHPATQVLVLTDLAWPGQRTHCLAAGAAACFDKVLEFEQARAWVAARAAA